MLRLFLIIAACLALAFAGCGDDSSSTSASGVGTTSAQEKAEAIEEEFKEREEAEAKKAAGKKAEVEKAAEERAAELPKPNVPSGPPPKKLVVKDVKEGSGATAKAGDEVAIHYVGVLYDSGELFGAKWKGDTPVHINLHEGLTVKGWYRGVKGMKVGGRRELIMPPGLAYGSAGSYPSIPPNATLVFLVELLEVR